MKRLLNVMSTAMLILLILSVWTAFAQSEKVSITYPSDTKETIARRAQWIKGSKQVGKLVWWGSMNPNLKTKIIAEFNKIYPFIKVHHWR